MTLTKSIAHNTAAQIFGKSISTLLGLLVVAIMTRVLGAEKFGYYATAVGFLQFVAVFTDFGFTVSTAKLLSEPSFDKQKILNNLFTWRLITAVLFQGTASGIIWLFPYPIEIKIITAILSLSFIANILNQVFVGFYQTKLRMGVVMIGEILGRLVLVIGAIVIAYGQQALMMMAMMWLITVSAWVYTIFLWIKSDGVKLQIDWQISRALYHAMWPTGLAIIFNACYLHGDRVLLPLYAPVQSVAFYNAAYRILDIMSQVGFLTMGVMLPLLTYYWSRDLKTEFKKYYQMSFNMMMLVLLPMVAGTIALAEPIMRTIAGKEFFGAGNILALLSISTLGVCFGMTYSQTAIAINQQRLMLRVFAIDAVLSVIAYFIIIPKFGMYGAASVTIFSEFFAGITLLILCSRHIGLWPKLGTTLKICLSAVLMGAIVYFLQPLNIAISILLGMFVYSAQIILLRVISLDSIKEVLRPKPQLPLTP